MEAPTCIKGDNKAMSHSQITIIILENDRRLCADTVLTHINGQHRIAILFDQKNSICYIFRTITAFLCMLEFTQGVLTEK